MLFSVAYLIPVLSTPPPPLFFPSDFRAALQDHERSERHRDRGENVGIPPAL